MTGIRNDILHLARGDTELEKAIDQTVPGMAHWANGGPFATTCGDCRFLGYRRNLPPKKDEHGRETARSVHTGGCLKYRTLTQRHGPPVPPQTPSCRHYEAKRG
jgi:hypothetical protein